MTRSFSVSKRSPKKGKKTRKNVKKTRSIKGGRLRFFKRIAPLQEDLTLPSLVSSAIEAYKYEDYDDYTFFRLKAQSLYGKEALLDEFEFQLTKQVQISNPFTGQQQVVNNVAAEGGGGGGGRGGGRRGWHGRGSRRNHK
jgi:hypothetical protein